MTAADIDPALREAIYVFETLRRLGFDSLDIHLHVQAKFDLIGILLKTQGKEFLWIVGVTGLPPDAVLPAWEAAAALWNATCNDKSVGWDWERSQARADGVRAIVAIQGKGITLPCGRKGLAS